RPDQYNTLDTPVRDGLFEAFARAEADTSVRAVILTAAGHKAFCAGRDLQDPTQASMQEVLPHCLPIIGDGVEVSKPVIAAVQAPAHGLGFIFAMMCDMVVAAREATFSVSEVKLGRGMAWAVPLAAMVPRKVMHELLFTGATITA